MQHKDHRYHFQEQHDYGVDLSGNRDGENIPKIYSGNNGIMSVPMIIVNDVAEIGKGFLQRLSSNDREPDTNAKRQNQSRHHIHDRGHSNREKGLDGTFLDTLNRRRINCTGYDFREDRLTRKKVRNPEKRVDRYAMAAVINKSFPAPFPNSPMAGATNPSMINGMKTTGSFKQIVKRSEDPANQTGTNCPSMIPNIMAITTRPNKGILFKWINILLIISMI